MSCTAHRLLLIEVCDDTHHVVENLHRNRNNSRFVLSSKAFYLKHFCYSASTTCEGLLLVCILYYSRQFYLHSHTYLSERKKHIRFCLPSRSDRRMNWMWDFNSDCLPKSIITTIDLQVMRCSNDSQPRSVVKQTRRLLSHYACSHITLWVYFLSYFWFQTKAALMLSDISTQGIVLTPLSLISICLICCVIMSDV